jgi:hypothetical protein
VDDYLDSLADQYRVAWITVRERRSNLGPGGGGSLDATMRGAPGGGLLAAAGGYGGGVTVGQLTVQVQADAAGRISRESMQETGRQAVAAIAAYERRNGTAWRGRRRP